MNKYLGIAIVFILSCSVVAMAEDTSTNMMKVVGLYSSKIESANKLRKGATRIQRTLRGIYYGNYSFVLDGTTYRGKLSGCKGTAALTVLCNWRDEFGKGTLTMKFTSDAFRAFNGYWIDSTDLKTRYVWNGSR